MLRHGSNHRRCRREAPQGREASRRRDATTPGHAETTFILPPDSPPVSVFSFAATSSRVQRDARRAPHWTEGVSDTRGKLRGGVGVQSSRAGSRPSSKLNGSRRELTNCPVCGCGVRRDRVDRHIKVVHPQSNTEPKPVQPSQWLSQPAEQPTAIDWTLCPRCGCRIKTKRLTRHMQQVHGIGLDARSRGVEAISSVRAALTASAWAPKMGESLKAHSASRAGLFTGGAAVASKAGRPKSVRLTSAASYSTPNPDVPEVARRIERAFDGSRDYYGFREHGQFGSHPVYDDLGDESDP